MGGKGGQSTNTVQNTAQTYNANPAISGIGTQAISQAQAAGSQPFQMPTAPVAGFSQDQNSAFQGIRNAQGMALPYMNTAASYFSPEGAQQFFNPYAANVMAGMKDVFGQQQVQNEGSLVNSAGGVGADRIGVGQANLAHQQDLAAGQTLSGLYSGAADMAQKAGYGIGALGTQAQNSVLQGAQAQLGAGGLQQQLDQMQLNAPYQNRLAQIAYPYQNAQFLAGITGGLAPAFGGTTYGNQNGATTPPQPSMLSQVMGVGTAGAGLYGAFGGFNGTGGSGKGSDAGTLNYGNLGGGTGGFTSGTYAEGGEVGEEENNPHIPGIPSSEGLAPIPYLPLHGGAGHSSPLTGGVTFQQPQQQKPADSGGGLGDVLKTAASVVPFFLKDGGVAGYEAGGDPYPMMAPEAVNPWILNPSNRRDTSHDNDPAVIMGESPSVKQWRQETGARPAATGYPGAAFADRFGAMAPAAAAAPTAGEFDNPHPVAGGAVPLPGYNPQNPTKAEVAGAYRMPSPTAKGTDDEDVHLPTSREVSHREIMRGMMPQAAQPYPDALVRDTGQNLTRSPWLALVNAGATMAATPGPLGVSLGKGMLAGTKSLDDQRKELQTEQGVNQKAQALYQTAKAELDKYNKMTPYEAGSLQLRNKEMDQSNVPGATAGVDPKLYLRARQIAGTEVNREVANNPSIAMGKAQIDALIAARTLAIMRGWGAGTAATPAAPAGPPSGAKFSPSTNKWWTPDGNSYQFDKDGKAY